MTSRWSTARTHAPHGMPTFSIDSRRGVRARQPLVRHAPQRQTLEPRLFYVNTPFRDQADAAELRFGARTTSTPSRSTPRTSFSGFDRVSDAHQLTAGATTRWLDADTGAETLRLGIAQRYLFRDQRVTPDGTPLTQRLSDVLLDGSTSLVPNWRFDAALQYSAEHRAGRCARSSACATAGAVPSLSADLPPGARLVASRSSSAGSGRSTAAQSAASGSGGVLQRHAVCAWAGSTTARATAASPIRWSASNTTPAAGSARFVAERLSTGRSEATTRLLLQLELVGLSRHRVEPAAGVEGQYPRIPPAARGAQRPLRTDDR